MLWDAEKGAAGMRVGWGIFTEVTFELGLRAEGLANKTPRYRVLSTGLQSQRRKEEAADQD